MTRFRLACASGLGVTALLVGGLASAAVTSTAHADPGDSAECPAAYPAADLTLGQQVTGLTTAGSYQRDGVEHDSTVTPEEFTGTYRGTIDDPTGDLYVFELAGSRVTNTDGSVDAGIWAGMSGSPVYAEDGRLIGSVSYSFSGTLGSVYAGVTPADQLYDLLDDVDPAAAAPARIKLSKKEQARLVEQGVPAPAAQQGLRRLVPETTIAGMRSARPAALERIAKRFDRSAPALIGGTAAQDEEIPITPGSNFANADSYGTIALYGVGTTTAVCDDLALAYGHPANWAPYTETVHGAVTTFIQNDGAWSYKMANLAAPMGTLVGDHMAGIVGRLGELPDTTTVSSTTTGPKPRQSATTVVNPDALGYVVANQAYLDTLLTLDQDAGGSVALSWKITFQRADGSTGVYTRSDAYADTAWLAELVTYDVADDVETIVNNPYEQVTVTDVEITEDATRDYRMLKVGSVELRTGSKWTKLNKKKPAPLKPGKTMKVRVNMVPSGQKSKAPKVSKVVSFKVPKKATKKGKLSVVAHGISYDDFLFDDEAYGTSARKKATSGLDALLARMKKRPSQDAVTIQLSHAVKGAAKPRSTSQTWRAPAVSTGRFTAKLKAN